MLSQHGYDLLHPVVANRVGDALPRLLAIQNPMGLEKGQVLGEGGLGDVGDSLPQTADISRLLHQGTQDQQPVLIGQYLQHRGNPLHIGFHRTHPFRAFGEKPPQVILDFTNIFILLRFVKPLP